MSAQDRVTLQAALQTYDQGHLAQAEPSLRSLAVKYPGSYQVNEALGSLYAEANQLDRALPYLQKSSKIAPREALAHANLGAVYLKLARPQEAVPELQRAATLDPENPATQANLGQALMLQKQPAAAAAAFAAAARTSPADCDLKYNLALALFNAGAFKEAAVTLETIPTASLTPEMHALAGDTEERAGDFVKALAHFEAAARTDPSEPNLYALTTELLRHWNWAEAITVANYASTRYPTATRFQMAAGIALYGKSDFKQAAVVFAQLLQADPANAILADLLGRSCGSIPDGTAPDCHAVADFVEHHPGNATMTTYAANAILREPADTRDLAKAEALLHTAIATDPQLAEAYLSLGILDQIRLQWQESATALERAIALRPTLPEAHYRLSRAYAHLGRRDEAQAEIALHQKYSKLAKDSLDARMQEVMRFILNPS